MSKFDAQTLENLKKLCRIECSPEEDQEIMNSLNRVLEYIDQLNEVNTNGVATCNYVLQTMLKNLMREDEVKELLPREQFLSNAPDQIGGMVRVPPVMKTP
ncbi:MAG: Asp-tRNA(Asn)/Glu-tRNA(Gln) amidotransferase subunit GatC [Verrucomicrobia bacterium]|nr:Asp-tRNA(Asn)/Glu-tRNA(Gln) amidotransferase subunit GatC [Verrucomicrobiota bacterium]